MTRTNSSPVLSETLLAPARPRLALVGLLGVTFLGTAANNILNVPLRDITRDLNVAVTSGVLVVSSFVIVLAAGITFSGWLGDRLGRRRVVVAAVVVMMAGLVGAALAPSLPVLVAMRAVQGLACAVYPPAVMGLLATAFGPARRTRLLGAWAAANGLGQAVGPPIGGALADIWGWRSIFWVLVPVSGIVLVALVAAVPHVPRRAAPLDVPGAVSFTAGAGLLMVAATAAPQHALPGWVVVGLAVAGIASLAGFVGSSRHAAHPLVDLHAVADVRYLRSAMAGAAQMFCLSAVLVGVPLYLTGARSLSTGSTGLIVLALPLTMAVLAPLVGSGADRLGPRRVLRIGLLVLAGSAAGLGAYLAGDGASLASVAVLLVVVGIGVALVQTPSATGVTRSPAGSSGAGLGLFNTMRFGASALGAAWVALTYPHGQLLMLFVGCAVVAGLGLVVSFVGRSPDARETNTAV